jgi:2-keto-4-pentenoate hydratase/2-oxohepta-3-ene-1,7-dioic acid hydratase in catechol pathway
VRLFAYHDEEGLPRIGRLERPDRIAVFAWSDSLSGLLVDGWTSASARLGETATSHLDRAIADPAPAVELPGKIVCVGLNYAEHAAEGGRSAPDRPLLFAKFANTVVGHDEPVIRPEGTRALDLEVELGVVIGRQARRVSAEDAMDHVAGYLVVNDISARDWQGTPQALAPGERGDGQWLRAKGSDTFLPMGPDLVTTDEIDPRDGLRIRSWRIGVDGTEQLMQDGSTRDLIHDVPALVAYISRAITLEPGDVIATGTPSGVGVFRDPPVFLQPGDRVRCEIEGIGVVENPIVDWADAEAD